MADETELELPRAENPDPRVAVALLVDTSSSMSGGPIAALNDGYEKFVADLGSDELARKRAEVTVVTFGNGGVKVAQDFAEAQDLSPITFSTGGVTPMSGALMTGLDLLEARKAQYQAQGLDYYRPWLFLITDGYPTDNAGWAAATARSRKLEAERGVSIFTVGVEGADMKRLGEIASRPPAKLDGLNFTEMFLWLSRSLSSVSSSTPVSTDPTAMAPLPPITEWATA